ncbi:DUF418 domain-containing protein [Caulobacter sp. 1776]|uniref:DUF418 domain-containing protein n=1 Tax=Caulobacter sp. 1776 TaxID=3156420 RepID=UPI00339ADE40
MRHPSRETTTDLNGRGSVLAAADGPVAPTQRIAALDVLRGFALLGILVLNIETFSGPAALHDVPLGLAKPAFVGWHATLDLVIFAIKWLFFEGKMRTLFSTLYGAGIVLITSRIEARGPSAKAADIFCRRNLWLLLFGLIHGTLIWQGDILSQYAVIALLFMFPFRNVPARRLIVLGLAIGVLGGTLGVAQAMDVKQVLSAERLRTEGAVALAQGRAPTPVQQSAIDDANKAKAAEPAEIQRSIAQGRRPYLESISSRTAGYFGFVDMLFHTGWILEVIGSMLLGMGLFKSGFLTGALSKATYLTTALVGYGIAAPLVLTGVAMVAASGFTVAAVTRWIYQPYAVEIFAGAIANASIVLLVVKSGWLRGVQAALANVGRTAFSNYILTSLLCQCLFAWGPWKLYGALDYYQQIYAVLGVWAVNLVLSALWLRAFTYGPLEWVWRSLVYWRRQPMRR